MTISNPFVLITGASGFVGNHTLANFLSHGYRVRIVARNQKSCNRLLQVHSVYRDQLETAIVPDITVPGAFDEAVKDVAGIIHMASPFVISIEDNERDLILPALKGTNGIFESAQRYGGKVQRIVITSSFAAVADFKCGLWPGHVYDESQWNPLTYEETKNDQHGLAYSGSKSLAEASAWSFMEAHPDIPFTLATINPVMIYGPPYAGTGDLKNLGTSLKSMYQLLTSGPQAQVRPTSLPFFVDVRDVAEAHRLAFEVKVPANPGRFLISGGKYSNEEVCKFWESHLGLQGKLPTTEGFAGPPESYEIDVARIKRTLGLSFRGFEECFGDMGKSLLELQQQTQG